MSEKVSLAAVCGVAAMIMALTGCGSATNEQLFDPGEPEAPVVGRQYEFTLEQTDAWQKEFAGPASSESDPNPDPWYVSVSGGRRGAQVAVYNEGIRRYSKAQLIGQNQVVEIKLGQLEYAALKPIEERSAVSIRVISVSIEAR